MYPKHAHFKTNQKEVTNMKKEKVYLIPKENGGYYAEVAPRKPTEDAVFLVEEGMYPVQIISRREYSLGYRTWDVNHAYNRTEMIASLNWIGNALCAVHQMWEYDIDRCLVDEILNLFSNCTRKREELLEAAETE
jgi:hypothetical protein